MIVLRVHITFQELIGLPSISECKYHRYFTIIAPIVALLLMPLSSLWLFLYFIRNFNDNIEMALSSLPHGSMYFMLSIIHVHILINHAHFYSLFEDIGSIVNTRMNADGKKSVYAQTQQRVRFLSKLCASIFAFWLSSLVPFVVVAYHWCIGKYSINSWIFVFPVWAPFEWNTSYCALAALFQALALICASAVFYITLSLFTELPSYIKAVVLDIKLLYDRMDRLAKSKNTELSILECCRKAVELHEGVYRCAHQFANVTNFMILAIVVVLVLVDCFCLLFIEKYWQTASTFDIGVSISTIIFSLKMLFICFCVGQNVHSDLMDLSDMIYQSDWYRYPSSVRRFMLLMMLRAQQPFYLSAYGMMRCTLENYVVVLKWIYSAFMLLRCMD